MPVVPLNGPSHPGPGHTTSVPQMSGAEHPRPRSTAAPSPRGCIMRSVGLALLGVGMIAWEVSLSWRMATALKAHGHSPGPAWRRLALPQLAWFGLIFVAGAVSEVAAAVLFGLMLLVMGTYVVILVSRGIRSAPAMVREVRRIGDPAAWRGDPAD